MKKLAVAVLALFVITMPALADLSYVGHGHAILGTAESSTTWYSLDDLYDPSFDSNNTTDISFDRTFSVDFGDELRLGGEVRTWDPQGAYGSDNNAYAELGWRVTTNRTTGDEAWNQLDLPWLEIDGADDKWREVDWADMPDVVNGLGVGTYYLEIYQHAQTNTGTEVWQNEAATGGNDWEAQIIVNVPEPGSVTLIAMGMLGLLMIRRIRRK